MRLTPPPFASRASARANRRRARVSSCIGGGRGRLNRPCLFAVSRPGGSLREGTGPAERATLTSRRGETDKQRCDVPHGRAGHRTRASSAGRAGHCGGKHEHPFGNVLDPSVLAAVFRPRGHQPIRTGRFAHRPATHRFAGDRSPAGVTPDEPGCQARTPPSGGFALSGILIHRPVSLHTYGPDDGRCTIQTSRGQIGVLREMRGFSREKPGEVGCGR
jgi:hypothetical protein